MGGDDSVPSWLKLTETNHFLSIVKKKCRAIKKVWDYYSRRYQNFSQKTLSLNEASQIVRRNSIFLSMNDFKNWYSCFSQFVFNSCQLDLGSVVKEVEVEIIIYQNTSILRDYLLICHYIHSVFKHLLRTYFCQTFGWSWTYKSE